jgi:hypothetical protein
LVQPGLQSDTVHAPPTQVKLVAQGGAMHEPQCWLLVETSMQRPAQHCAAPVQCGPPAQVHLLCRQLSPDWQC